MAEATSTYEMEDRIVAALKKRGGVATAGDVAADTGLHYGEVEIALRRMLSIYKSHLDVDDEGNLRYRFDPKFVRRGEEAGRFWYDLKQAAWTAFKWFFKVWILVTLVGYTIVFVLLLLALAVAGIAASASSDSDSDGLIELPLYLLARFLEIFFWISLFDDDRSHRRRRGRVRHRPGKGKPEKAVYQKVFDYVFGPERKSDPMKAQMAFTQFVREMNGRVTAADWASRTGQSLDEAESALTAAVVRFNGDVDVSDEGHLVYRFDELMVTAARQGTAARGPRRIWESAKKAAPLTGNPGGTNFWITGFNLFNLAMSGFILTGAGDAVAQGFAVDPGILYGLGVIPFVFSLIFFAVPLVRWIGHAGDERRAQRENERRQEIRKIYASVQGSEARPVQVSPHFEKDLALAFDGEPKVDNAGTTYYFFDGLKAELDAGERARQASAEVVFGETVFSSDEEQKSLAQSELEDFDARLARELEGSHVEFDVAVPETVTVH